MPTDTVNSRNVNDHMFIKSALSDFLSRLCGKQKEGEQYGRSRIHAHIWRLVMDMASIVILPLNIEAGRGESASLFVSATKQGSRHGLVLGSSNRSPFVQLESAFSYLSYPGRWAPCDYLRDFRLHYNL